MEKFLRVCIGLALLILVGQTAYAALTYKTKTTKFFVFQETGTTGTTTALEKSFSLFVGEPSPVVKNAYIEFRGISASAASQSVDVQIKQPTDGSYTGLQTFTFASPNQSHHFKFRYDVTTFFNARITQIGSHNFVLYFKNNGPAVIDVLQARAYNTYQFTPGYRTTGYIISSTFDTTATNGVAPNSIMWLGTLPSTSHVKFQFASSNSSSGPWSYVGSDGTSNTYYEPSAANTPLKINLADVAAHNNKRYFRYKVILEPTEDRQDTPTADDVILNWSP